MTQENLFDLAVADQPDPAQQRKDDLRRKIVLGAICQRVIGRDKLRSILDRHVWGARDRALFGLPPRQQRGKAANGDAAEAAEGEAEGDAS